MRRLRIVIIALLLAVLGTPAVVTMASNVTGALFSGIISITNTDTAETNVATTANISTTNLINGGYINSSANNCVVRNTSGSDVPFMPGYTPNANPWCIWVSTIDDSELLSYILYTADSSGGDLVYFPANAGMTVVDNATIELGDNFTIEQSGWIDTTYAADKNFVSKEDAIDIYNSATENVTAIIHAPTWTLPTSYDDPDAKWVDEALAYDANTGTYAYDTLASASWSAYLTLILPGDRWIDSARTWTSNNSANISIDLWINGAWLNVHEAANTDGSYQTKNFDGDIGYFTDRARVKLYTAGANPRLNEFNFGVVPGVRTTDISSSDAILTTEADGTLFGIGVDEVNSDSWPLTNDLLLNAPFYHVNTGGASFTTKDANKITLTADGTTWSQITGRTFDGATDYIDAGDQAELSFTDGAGNDEPFSIEAWINRATLNTFDCIASKRDDLTDIEYAFDGTDTGKYQIRLYNTGAAAYITKVANDAISADTWYHVVMTYDGSEAHTGLLLYQDGQLVAATGTLNGAYTGMSNTVASVKIGALNAGGADNNFDGRIGEVRFYGSALTPSQVLANYNATKWKYDGLGVSWPDYDAVSSGVPNNANNLSIIENLSMMYMDYTDITIGGTPTAYWDWEYGATFTDSVNSIVATPSFRTTTSDADITAALASFQPISQAQAPAYVLDDPDPLLTPDTGNVTSQFTTTPDNSEGFPLAGVITAVADATSTPAQLPLLIIASIIIIAISFCFSAFTRQYGSGTIFIKVLLICAVMGVFVALANFSVDFWMVVVFSIIGTALAMASKQLGWT